MKMRASSALAVALSLALWAGAAGAGSSTKGVVLYVGAHPGDLGTVAGLAFRMKGDYDFRVADFTRGEGSCGPDGFYDGSAGQIRAEEERKACALLGCEPVFLGQTNFQGRLAFADETATRAIEDLIWQLKPKAVITHWPVDADSDHLQCSAAVQHAVYNVQRDRNFSTELYFSEGSPSQTMNYCSTYSVDVTPFEAKALELVNCYVSQDGAALARDKAARLRERGREAMPPVVCAETYTTFSGDPLVGGVLEEYLLPIAGGETCEEEFAPPIYLQDSFVSLRPLDCSTLFPVGNLSDDPALRNLNYSAIGWELDAAEDASRKVTVTAQAGTMVGGSFKSDGSAPQVLLENATGRGEFDWTVTEIARKVYQLKHVVSKNGTVDSSATLSGYLDFSGYSTTVGAVREGELTPEARLADGARAHVVMDLEEGVRTPKYLSYVLPFEYSSTNWIGDVKGVTVSSVASVTIVQLAGDDPDVTKWAEVQGTSRELKKAVGEDAVKWKARKGVWKATFDILNGDSRIHRETVIFDLRDSKGTGFVLTVS